MAHDNSPSSVMYAELKTLGISNRDTASALLDVNRAYGDATVLDRINSRTQLSRSFVHVAPGDVPLFLFKDFTQSSQTLLGRIIAKSRRNGEADPALMVRDYMAGPAAQTMQQALRDYNIDDNVYRNALAHIANLSLDNETDRALLYLMLFIVTGSTGDPHEGVRTVEQFSSNRVGASFRTTEAHVGIAEEEPEDDFALGLMRIVGGKLKGPDAFYLLNATEKGTEIGTLSSEAGSITDVDADVSRRHARIYKQNGHWYVIGLGSTNGTTVISGDDKMEHVVEPPKRERERNYSPEPYEIFPTDTICLGSSTRFMVMPMLGE